MSVRNCGSASELSSICSSAAGKLVVVDFFATWCGPCKAISPHVADLAQKYASSVVFVKVDVDQARDVMQQYKVQSMPTFVFLAQGREVSRFSGANAAELTATVERLSKEHSRSTFQGQGAGVAGGAAAEGDGFVNPWARKNFKPPGMAALGGGAAAADAAAAPAAGGSAAGAAAAPGTKQDFDVVCDGDVCRRVPRAPVQQHESQQEPPAYRPRTPDAASIAAQRAAAAAAAAAAGAAAASSPTAGAARPRSPAAGGAGALLAAMELRRQEYYAKYTPESEAAAVKSYQQRREVEVEVDTLAKNVERSLADKDAARQDKERRQAEAAKALLKKRTEEDKKRRADEARLREQELARIREAKHG